MGCQIYQEQYQLINDTMRTVIRLFELSWKQADIRTVKTLERVSRIQPYHCKNCLCAIRQ